MGLIEAGGSGGVGVGGCDAGGRVKHKNFDKNTFNIHIESLYPPPSPMPFSLPSISPCPYFHAGQVTHAAHLPLFISLGSAKYLHIVLNLFNFHFVPPPLPDDLFSTLFLLVPIFTPAKLHTPRIFPLFISLCSATYLHIVLHLFI